MQFEVILECGKINTSFITKKVGILNDHIFKYIFNYLYYSKQSINREYLLNWGSGTLRNIIIF